MALFPVTLGHSDDACITCVSVLWHRWVRPRSIANRISTIERAHPKVDRRGTLMRAVLICSLWKLCLFRDHFSRAAALRKRILLDLEKKPFFDF